jgi:flagellar biosynthesis/type III secretory pathway protein FliH
MSVFRLDFNAALPSIQSGEARVVIQDVEGPDEEFQRDVLNSITAVQSQIEELKTAVARDLQVIRDNYAAAVIELARVVLGEDDALVEKRVKRFLDAAMEAMPIGTVTKVFVNPRHVPVIIDGLQSAGGQGIEVIGDEKVAAGDCRVENGMHGFSATMEAILLRAKDMIEFREGSQ